VKSIVGNTGVSDSEEQSSISKLKVVCNRFRASDSRYYFVGSSLCSKSCNGKWATDFRRMHSLGRLILPPRSIDSWAAVGYF
jgi:hypothetical protein